jgi:hypothetical protein
MRLGTIHVDQHATSEPGTVEVESARLAHAATSIGRAQNEALHCLGETLVIVRVGRNVGLLFHVIGGIAHGDA